MGFPASGLRCRASVTPMPVATATEPGAGTLDRPPLRSREVPMPQRIPAAAVLNEGAGAVEPVPPTRATR